jgi:hypothetical protein
MRNLILKFSLLIFALAIYNGRNGNLIAQAVGTSSSYGKESIESLESRLFRLGARARALGVSSQAGLPIPAPEPLAETPSILSSTGDGSGSSRIVAAEPKGKALGDYYVLPFFGLSLPSSVGYEAPFGGNSKFGTETGYLFGLMGGRNFGRWFGEVHFEYGQSEFGSIEDLSPSLPSVSSVSGDSELINFGVRAGFLHHLSTNSWFQFGLGVGFANREDSLVAMLPGRPQPLPSDSSLTYTYDALVDLGFSFSESLHARFGYRYLGAGENGNFGTLRHHLIELGLGADF